MTVGAASAVANSWLNVLRGTTYTGITALYVKLHIGDPGTGASNAAAVTIRNQLTLAAASGGVAALSALSNYAMTATETISHVSVWDDPTAGSLVATGALTVPKSVNNGDTLVFNTFSASISPIAA